MIRDPLVYHILINKEVNAILDILKIIYIAIITIKQLLSYKMLPFILLLLQQDKEMDIHLNLLISLVTLFQDLLLI